MMNAQPFKWIGVFAGVMAIYMSISMYPDVKRYLRLRRM